ncbi:MAG: glutathione S-transferase [Rhodobacteraceae bacterium]|nr:glutathione S-transferase [Paracoccaceae bacterium]
MQIIGMMDSPYVRRVAISLKFLRLQFDHVSLSVFSQFDAVAAVNPVVKVPTLVTDDGMVLMDSTLILQVLERLAPKERRLTPTGETDFLRAQRLVGLALAACEKTVQIVYERNLRPPEKHHQPWIDRVRAQLLAACGLLETAAGPASGWLLGTRPTQADVAVGVAWRFTQDALPDVIHAEEFPGLSAFSARAESRPEFLACPPV